MDFIIGKNRFTVTINPIPIRDYLLFEEKKIEPNTLGATANSIGINNAIRWFFPKYLTVCINNSAEQILTDSILTMYNFEYLHLMRILGNINKVEGEAVILDDVDDVADSDDFIYQCGKEQFHVIRSPIPWSETPKFVKQQKNNRNHINIFKMNIDFIKQYFTINGNSITDDDLDAPDKIPIQVYLLMVQRLGKFLAV